MMSVGRSALLLLLPLGVLLFGGCASLQRREPIEVIMVGVEPLQGEGLELRMLVKLRIQNPNDLPLDFDERDFSKLEAEELRVKICLPEGFGLNVEESWLEIEISSAAGVHDATFKLDEEIVRGVLLPGGILSSPGMGTEYIMRLSAPSTAKLRELQTFVTRAPVEDINIRVVPKLSSYPEDATSVKVWISLLLSPAQGYFALLDGATISLDKLRERRHGAQQGHARVVPARLVVGVRRQEGVDL